MIDLQCPRWTPDRVLIRKVWRRLDRPVGRFPTLFFWRHLWSLDLGPPQALLSLSVSVSCSSFFCLSDLMESSE